MTNLTQEPTLVVENLLTQFTTRAGVVNAVNEISFSVMPGQIMGLVGESGSGKSMTGYSIMGLIDAPGKVAGEQRSVTFVAKAQVCTVLSVAHGDIGSAVPKLTFHAGRGDFASCRIH